MSFELEFRPELHEWLSPRLDRIELPTPGQSDLRSFPRAFSRASLPFALFVPLNVSLNVSLTVALRTSFLLPWTMLSSP